MADFAARVELAPEPRSAATARRWMREVLESIARDDLVESASAGVSELVTNGILHAHTALLLVVQAFDERVVVSVTDRSPLEGRARLGPSVEHDRDSTVGRGLRIVRAYASEWGITTSAHGKAIWFVPLEASSIDAPDIAGPELELLGEQESVAPDEHGPVVPVVLRDAPLAVIRQFQDSWIELIRELQLIALGEPSELQALAQEFSELVPQVRTSRWITAESADAIPAARAAGKDRVDVRLEIPTSMRDSYIRVEAILDHLDAQRHHELLLYLSGGAQDVKVRDWWLSEIIRQLDGAPARPWDGAFEVDETPSRPRR
ncbi:MAG: ATP-binding protein [Nocardioidaceae bacterium]